MQVAGREILFTRCHSEGAGRPNESAEEVERHGFFTAFGMTEERRIRILHCVQNDRKNRSDSVILRERSDRMNP